MLIQVYKNISDRKYSLLSWLEFFLIILSSILLGIWAAANTIALRNILLVLGTLLSIAYFYQLHRQGQLKQYFGVRNLIPLFCIIGLFLWVLAHCFLFPTDYSAQIKELQSTWLRSALAATVGVATGIAIIRNPTKIYWMWIGMILSFAYLLVQYFSDVFRLNTLLVSNYMQYIFLGKVNGVLIGSILIAGILGTRLSSASELFKSNVTITVIGLLSILMVLFSFLNVLSTRNGYLIVFIIISLYIYFELKRVLNNINVLKTLKTLKTSKSKLLIAIVAGMAIMLSFVLHIQKNPQWSNIIEDISISSQIDRFETWKSPEQMGPPQSPEGRYISANTYLRVAWFFAGITIAPQNYYGHGVLINSFQRAIEQSIYAEAKVKSSHSAFLELYFAFGLPGLFFIFTPIIYIAYSGSKYKINFSPLASFLAISLVLLMLLSEASNSHSIEIFFYLICLAAILQNVNRR